MSSDYEQLRVVMGDIRRAIIRLSHISRNLGVLRPYTDLAGEHSQRVELFRSAQFPLEDLLEGIKEGLERRCAADPIDIPKPEPDPYCLVCFIPVDRFAKLCETCGKLPMMQPDPDDDIPDPFET
jgi:hypothetical protein